MIENKNCDCRCAKPLTYIHFKSLKTFCEWIIISILLTINYIFVLN